MRAAIFSPYLDTLGGGERYVSSVAKILSDAGWDVDLESRDGQIGEKLSRKFGLDLSKVGVVDSVKRGDGYDLCFWLSDGSVPALLARKNILHFQRPFWGVDGKSLINRMKFFRINRVVVNSKFTKSFIDREYPCKSVVLYPPVDIAKFRARSKENLILYIGRFSQLEQAKGQDVLLSAFKKLFDQGAKGWRLVLAGGSEVGRTDFVDRLRGNAQTYPVKILENPKFEEIKDFYGRAKIFWSASGFGVDVKKDPNKVEHFGITAVEAMAAGCVPFLYNAGGHREIVESGKSGFLWEGQEQLIVLTQKLIADPQGMARVVKSARDRSKYFSYERFEKEFLDLL